MQRYTDSDIADVAKALHVAMREGADRFNVQIEQTEALERLHLAEITLRDKKHVTHLGQKKTRGKDCPKSVTGTPAEGQPPPPIAPQLWPTDYVTVGKEAAPCAVYLP